jgi:hypothetical protein
MTQKKKDTDSGLVEISLTPLHRLALLMGDVLVQKEKRATMLMNQELRDVLKITDAEQEALASADGETYDPEKLLTAKAKKFKITLHAFEYVRARLRKLDSDDQFSEDYLPLWDQFVG